MKRGGASRVWKLKTAFIVNLILKTFEAARTSAPVLPRGRAEQAARGRQLQPHLHHRQVGQIFEICKSSNYLRKIDFTMSWGKIQK